MTLLTTCMRILIFLQLFSVITYAQTATLTILSFNDVYEIIPDQNGRGGFAHMQTLLNRERASAAHHITTVNGDFLSPCLLSIFDKGAHRIELFNMLGIDVVALGNHEFDFGPDEVRKRIAESNFPWLAANAIGLDGNPFTGPQQTLIVDVEGIKVGFFGLITVETSELSSTEKKVCFAPLVFTARQMIRELKAKGADVIVALTHLLIEEDRQLAKEVPEIDVILGGHDHDPITWYDDKTFVHKSGQNAYYLARIDLVMEKEEGNSRARVFPSWKVILNKGAEPDPVMAAKVDGYQEVLQKVTSEPIGVIDMQCDSLYSNVRAKETEWGNLVADSLRFGCQADAAIVVGGIIRGNRLYYPGMRLNLKDLLMELPFGNLSVVVEISGASIRAALENGVSQVEGKAGRFPQVSGIIFSYDATLPPGKRIVEVLVNGEPLEEGRLYKVATVDYLFHGGDGYHMFKSGRIILPPQQKVDLVGLVAKYIKMLPSLRIPIEDRIIVRDRSRTLDDTEIPL